MSNIVAIVGRPNVGKSTLFNRLTESRKAIVDELSGVTRDRHYGKCVWGKREFSVIDTGGFVSHSDDIYEEEIRKQVLLAIEEADLILFMVDVTAGITDLDDQIAKLLRKIKKRVLLVVNKVDNNQRLYDAHQFYKLGLGDLYPVSSINGSGTGDLLDAILPHLKKTDSAEQPDIPRIAVVGRPNVGKSTLINTLAGEERTIVTPLAGTTRDTIYTKYNKYNHDFYLIDTAGLRKKGKVHSDLEFYSVLRSVRAIEDSDVSILLLDAERGIESQDVNIFRLIERNKKGVVVAVNKWDLVTKEKDTHKIYEAAIRDRIAPFKDVPVHFISATEKKRISRILDEAIRIYNNRNRKIPTSKLNEVMLKAIEAYHPPSVRGKYIKIKYITQLPTPTPSFAFFCNFPKYIREPYKRYLENKLREHFDFTGVPLQLYFRKK